jgi:hypothetical protein
MLSLHMEAYPRDHRRRRRPGDEHKRQPKAAFTLAREVVTTFRTQAVGEEHGTRSMLFTATTAALCSDASTSTCLCIVVLFYYTTGIVNCVSK